MPRVLQGLSEVGCLLSTVGVASGGVKAPPNLRLLGDCSRRRLAGRVAHPPRREEYSMKFTSYWLDTAPQGSPARSRTTVDGRTDVAVIGGGLTGVVAALHLARRGAKVHLFEQHTVGFGASGRNGGMATTGMSIGIRHAVDKLGFDTAVRLYGAYTEAIDLIEKLVTEQHIDCDFARTGKLTLAS